MAGSGDPAAVDKEKTMQWRPDGPGSFRSPAGVERVQDARGRLWVRRGTRWTADGKTYIRWRVLVDEHGPLCEAFGARR